LDRLWQAKCDKAWRRTVGLTRLSETADAPAKAPVRRWLCMRRAQHRDSASQSSRRSITATSARCAPATSRRWSCCRPAPNPGAVPQWCASQTPKQPVTTGFWRAGFALQCGFPLADADTSRTRSPVLIVERTSSRGALRSRCGWCREEQRRRLPCMARSWGPRSAEYPQRTAPRPRPRPAL
jgi:hypothetical protein